jgi:hypothetical protein
LYFIQLQLQRSKDSAAATASGHPDIQEALCLINPAFLGLF